MCFNKYITKGFIDEILNNLEKNAIDRNLFIKEAKIDWNHLLWGQGPGNIIGKTFQTGAALGTLAVMLKSINNRIRRRKRMKQLQQQGIR